MYNGFSHEQVVVISKALNLIEKRMNQYFEEKKKSVDISHHDVIDLERNKEIQSLDNTREILKKADDYSIFVLDERAHSSFMSVIKSALEIYLQDLSLARAATGFSTFDLKINEVRQVIAMDSLKNSSSHIFAKYYMPHSISEEGKTEIFLSYSTQDKVLAGMIAQCIREKEFGIFLAHEDIDISDEWRKEILVHLKKDKILISLLTPNYEKTVWGNQEVLGELLQPRS